VNSVQFEQSLLKRENLDTVEGAFEYKAGRELTKPGLRMRERIQIELIGEEGKAIRWYLKRYGRRPFIKRLLDWFIGTGRVSPARREYENIARLASIGVPTMRVITWGEDRDLLGAGRSYIIVSAVPGEALERCFEDYLVKISDDADAMKRFNRALVDIVRKLHEHGFVHRDLYASHIFLNPTPDGPELYLIDLARVFSPARWRRFRWRVKDLAELKYSMPAAWVDKFWDDFLGIYLREGESFSKWSRAIDRKVAWMRRRNHRRSKAKKVQ